MAPTDITTENLGRPLACHWALPVANVPILLQKSVSVDDLSGISLRAVGVDLPTLTLSTQLPRYAMHMAPAGGGRATSDASRRRFWAIAPEQTHPGRLVDHAAEADPASGCASSVRTASRSSCAHAATARSSRCQRTIGQRLGHAHGYRAGSCVMVPLGSTAV